MIYGMKLASFYKNKLVPSYDRISILTQAIKNALEFVNKQEMSDPELTDDSKPYVRRQEVMNSIIKVVRTLPREWRMSVIKKKAGGNFNYVLVRFEDLNINLVPIHLITNTKLPKPSGYRGDMSEFNFAIMKELGMESEMDFQTHITLEEDIVTITTDPVIPANIDDIPFGLLLIYDGTNMEAPLRLAALTPNQERYIFCDDVELLKKYSEVSEERRATQATVEINKRRKVKLDTSQVKDYQEIPPLPMKMNERRSEK